jgi:hypothetical protein
VITSKTCGSTSCQEPQPRGARPTDSIVRGQLNDVHIRQVPDNEPMVLLNVVCFGPKQKMMHNHVISAQDAGRLTDSGKFRVEWHDRPRPGILNRLSLVTYVPSHGGEWSGGASGLWINRKGNSANPVGGSFAEFGAVGGRAVVLDACSTASDRWLYDGGWLRAECQSLKGKPFLGGSGDSEPNELTAEEILDALFDVLGELEDAALTDYELLAVLEQVQDRAARRAAGDGKRRRASRIRAAYRACIVTETPRPCHDNRADTVAPRTEL